MSLRDKKLAVSFMSIKKCSIADEKCATSFSKWMTDK